MSSTEFNVQPSPRSVIKTTFVSNFTHPTEPLEVYKASPPKNIKNILTTLKNEFEFDLCLQKRNSSYRISF